MSICAHTHTILLLFWLAGFHDSVVTFCRFFHLLIKLPRYER